MAPSTNSGFTQSLGVRNGQVRVSGAGMLSRPIHVGNFRGRSGVSTKFGHVRRAIWDEFRNMIEHTYGFEHEREAPPARPGGPGGPLGIPNIYR